MEEVKKEKTIETWNLDVECNGCGNDETPPCNKHWNINSDDIVKRHCAVMFGEYFDIYGFICPECKCFTEVDETSIPEVIINRLNVKKKGFFKRLFNKL